MRFSSLSTMNSITTHSLCETIKKKIREWFNKWCRRTMPKQFNWFDARTNHSSSIYVTLNAQWILYFFFCFQSGNFFCGAIDQSPFFLTTVKEGRKRSVEVELKKNNSFLKWKSDNNQSTCRSSMKC